MAWYSSLGNVKLSRTSLGFLTLISATGFALVLGFAVLTVAVFDTGFLAVAVLVFTGALRILWAGDLDVAFRTAFLAVPLTGCAGAVLGMPSA